MLTPREAAIERDRLARERLAASIQKPCGAVSALSSPLATPSFRGVPFDELPDEEIERRFQLVLSEREKIIEQIRGQEVTLLKMRGYLDGINHVIALWEEAQGIEAGTAETAKQAPCEAQEPSRPKADAP